MTAKTRMPPRGNRERVAVGGSAVRTSRYRTPSAIHATDSFGDGVSPAGPYEELNVPLAPFVQPVSGRKRAGCVHGASAIAATNATMASARRRRVAVVHPQPPRRRVGGDTRRVHPLRQLDRRAV